MSELAIDTSTAACAVALLVGDEVHMAMPLASRLLEPPGHARELLPAIEHVIGESGTKIDELESVAVGIGPGAFTGLRIGVATARAIATARGIGVKPVSSLAALAAVQDGAPRTIAMTDARRKEIFYRVDDRDELGSPEAAVAAAAQAAASGPVCAVGDGAIKLRDQLIERGVHVPLPDDDAHLVDPVAMLVIARELQPVEPESVLPNYIRPPDAKVSTRESWLVGAGR